MKISYYSLFLILFITSCFGEGHRKKEIEYEKTLRKKEALEIASNYTMSKFKEPRKEIGRDGIITISDNQVSIIIEPLHYIINPSQVFVGFINNDNEMDAIVSIASYKGHYLIPSEHLFLTNSDGKLILNRVIESDMKILQVKDSVITAEIRTHSPNSPLYNCASCREVIKYKFRTGELIRME
jgi:hypothetical protein